MPLTIEQQQRLQIDKWTEEACKQDPKQPDKPKRAHCIRAVVAQIVRAFPVGKMTGDQMGELRKRIETAALRCAEARNAACEADTNSLDCTRQIREILNGELDVPSPEEVSPLRKLVHVLTGHRQSEPGFYRFPHTEALAACLERDGIVMYAEEKAGIASRAAREFANLEVCDLSIQDTVAVAEAREETEAGRFPVSFDLLSPILAGELRRCAIERPVPEQPPAPSFGDAFDLAMRLEHTLHP